MERPLIISDGPPGIGCPVISSLTGSDLAVIVTEPSVSGRTDLIRILDLCDHFRVRTAVIINKCDIDPDSTEEIRLLAREKESEIIGEIPFDMSVLDTLSEGRTVVECEGCKISQEVREIWKRIEDRYIKSGQSS
jgi:MinD superfamily P-loop ATPase